MAIRIRRANTNDAQGIARVHIDTWRTTYHGILPEEFLSSLTYDRARRKWETTNLNPKSQDAVYVAEDESRNIVGFATCGPDRDNDPVYKGELYGIYVLEKMQRRGIGRQLMLAVVQDLKNRGFSSMLVWVLVDNPSKRFYELLGGEHVQTRNITMGGKLLKEFGHGWENLDSILVK
jgi:ribosomal protein S18 acetylase RimI-like enzyme